MVGERSSLRHLHTRYYSMYHYCISAAAVRWVGIGVEQARKGNGVCDMVRVVHPVDKIQVSIDFWGLAKSARLSNRGPVFRLTAWRWWCR